MHFKMIIVFTEDDKTDDIMDAARSAGATGATVIHNARGEGLKVSKTFFGLSLETQRDVLLFLVEEHLSRHILEEINRTIRNQYSLGYTPNRDTSVQGFRQIEVRVKPKGYKVQAREGYYPEEL